MAVIRAFVAIDLPNDVNKCLEKVSRDLQKHLAGIPIRWVPIHNIHLTLKFLGDVSESNLEVLKQILDAEANLQTPFEISVGGLGAFPKIKRPRVIWTGIEAPDELIALQKGIEVQTNRLGYSPDKKPFSAHLTLGRVSRNINLHDLQRVGDLLDSLKVGFVGAAMIQSIHLYRSDLRPQGAVYTKLHTAQFGA